MTLSEQYDEKKQETADRFRETDAVDEVYGDLQRLLHKTAVELAELQGLIEEVEEYIHYSESLEYILRQIPDKAKRLLV